MPEAFGFHENAEITCATDTANKMLMSILTLQPRAAGGTGKSREDIIDELAVDINQRVEGPYDMEPVMKLYPVVYDESMNTVLQQEITRYNKLLAEIKRSLSEIRKALVGQLVMTETLDSMGTNMFNQLVPENWSKKAYPSLKPLASWTNDLLARMDFLTGTLQNFARKYQKAIDTISFETVVMRVKDE